METETPLVLMPPVAAAQISITDCGSWVEVALSSAWQFVADRPADWSAPTDAGSWITTGPLLAATLALVSTRLRVIVTCSA